MEILTYFKIIMKTEEKLDKIYDYFIDNPDEFMDSYIDDVEMWEDELDRRARFWNDKDVDEIYRKYILKEDIQVFL